MFNFIVPKLPQNDRGAEDPTMVKMLQEVKTNKTAIFITQGPYCVLDQI